MILRATSAGLTTASATRSADSRSQGRAHGHARMMPTSQFWLPSGVRPLTPPEDVDSQRRGQRFRKFVRPVSGFPAEDALTQHRCRAGFGTPTGLHWNSIFPIPERCRTEKLRRRRPAEDLPSGALPRPTEPAQNIFASSLRPHRHPSELPQNRERRATNGEAKIWSMASCSRCLCALFECCAIDT